MSHLRGIPAVMLSLVLCSPMPAPAAEPVGEATLIRTEVTGARGPLVVRAPVHRDERIKTSISGLGQFIFRDGTKLAVGAGSSVVIDNYVYDDANSAKKLTIRAAKGTFRWISGNSSSAAYSRPPSTRCSGASPTGGAGCCRSGSRSRRRSPLRSRSRSPATPMRSRCSSSSQRSPSAPSTRPA